MICFDAKSSVAAAVTSVQIFASILTNLLSLYWIIEQMKRGDGRLCSGNNKVKSISRLSRTCRIKITVHIIA